MPTPLFDLEALRKKALFDNYGLTEQNDPFTGQTPSIMPPMRNMQPPPIDELGGFDTTDRDNFRRLVNSVPEREDPGIGRRLVASGMGLGAKDPLGTMEGVMYAPHLRAMSDWTAQVEPSYRSAQLENIANANERQLQGNILTNRTNADRYAETARIADDRNRITQEKNERDASIRERKNEIESSWRLGYKYERVGNKLIGTRPDGSTFEAGEAADFSPMALERLRQDGRMAVQGLRNEGAIATKEATPGYNENNPAGRSSTAKAEEDKRNQILQRAYDTPETRDLITPPATANGLWQLVPPKKSFGPWGSVDPVKKAAYDRLYSEIYGTPAPTTIQPTTTPTAPQTTKPAPPIGPSKPPAGPTKVAPNVYGGTKGLPKQEPAFYDAARTVVDTAKGAFTPPKAAPVNSGPYSQQVMTPEGPKTVPPGMVGATNLETGEVGFIPAENIAAAEASGKFKRIK